MKLDSRSLVLSLLLFTVCPAYALEDGVEARVRAPAMVSDQKADSFSNDDQLAKLNAKLENKIDADTLLKRARVYVDKGNFASALDDLDNSLSMKKRLTEAIYLRAYVRTQLKEFEKAQSDYEEYLKVRPTNAKAWISLAACYEALNKNEKALEAFDRAIQADPKELIIYANKADLYGRMNDYQSAMKVIGQCLSVDPHCHVCLYERAFLKEAVLHDDKGALDDLSSLIADNDVYPKVFLERAVVEIKLGNLDAAKKDYDTMLKMYPKMDVGWSERAALEFSRGEYKEAAQDYSKAIALSPGRSDLLVRRAEVDRYLHDLNAAQVDSGQALRMNPDNYEAFMERAYAFMSQLRPTDARPDFDRVIQLVPKKAEAYFGRAFSQAETGDYVAAAADFQQVINLGGSDLSYAYVYSALMHKLADAESEAGRVLNDAAAKLDHSSWPYPIVEYLQGTRKDEALLAAADTKEKQVDAHLAIG
ncbi:MAG TPA: tetratricopeptide repeat protein, partial [Chroococcales cyanobacterium]